MAGASVQAVRSVAAILIGYVLFVAGTWLAQEAILGGVSYSDDLVTLALAAIFTPLAAVAGGLLTAAIAGARPIVHVAPMCLLIALETGYLYATGRTDGPLWFEAMSGASLIVGAVVGALAWSRWSDPRRRSVAA